MKEVLIKGTQAALQKTIKWTKKSGKGCIEWEKTCIQAGLPPRVLKTPVKTRFASRYVFSRTTFLFYFYFEYYQVPRDFSWKLK